MSKCMLAPVVVLVSNLWPYNRVGELMDGFEDIFDLDIGHEGPIGDSFTLQDTVNGGSLIYDDKFQLVGDVKPWLNGSKISFYGSSLDFEELSDVGEGILEQSLVDEGDLSLPHEIGFNQGESEILSDSSSDCYRSEVGTIESDNVFLVNDSDYDDLPSNSPSGILLTNSDPLDLDQSMDIANFDPGTPEDLVVGDPADDMQNWEYQGNSNRCALYSQKFIIEGLTGQDVPIEELVHVAEDYGWYDENSGTMPHHLDKILNYYDIDTVDTSNATLSDIEEILKNGAKVMAPVDIDELYDPNHDNSIFAPNDPNHMVQIIGIDRSNPSQPMIVLNDSGHPDGKGALIPEDQFDKAWDDSGRRMITAC